VAPGEYVLVSEVGGEHVDAHASGCYAAVVLARAEPLEAPAAVLIRPGRGAQLGTVAGLGQVEVVVGLDCGPVGARHVDALPQAAIVAFAPSVFASWVT